MATTRDGEGHLNLGGVRLADVARDSRVATPAYVYDLDGIAAEGRALQAAFDDAPHLVAYAMKANSAGSIVRALAAEGCGADVVSGAELQLARACGVPASKIVFSGVAKSDAELDAAIGAEIAAIHVESLEEIDRVAARAAALQKEARVSIRMNPGVEADTHAHIATGHDEAKFGVPRADVGLAIDRALGAARVALVGVTAHAGSQLVSTDAYVASARVVFGVAQEARARGARLRYVDAGGGFGIDYGAGCPARPADFVRAALAAMREARLDDLALNVEPGRSLVGAHGVLLATVIQPKLERAGGARRWLMIDAGMNDLIRPALYQARHRIVDVVRSADAADRTWRVVGPVCESSDDFGAHDLDGRGPLVAILDAGAYGYTMASRYNGRALPSEVFLRGGAIAHVVARAPVDAWVADRLGA